jgi:DNA-binding SARP family transcriptional activator
MLLDLVTEAEGADPRAAGEEACMLLGRPMLKLADLLALEAAIGLIGVIERRGIAGFPDLREEIAGALAGAIGWLDRLRLPAFIIPILEGNKGRLSSRDLKSWRARATALQRERNADVAPRRDDGRIRISMLGTIEIELPSGEKQRVQGARLRSVLGLMAANQMLDRPLTHREFCAIATGEESPEKARNIVYVKLHALREVLGDGAIITETDDAPRLDLRRVQVDLLEAHELLADVRAAMRERALLRATPALLRALELAHGEVPFPGLYEEFFEAAREDFENAVRSAAIGVARELMREGDLGPVEEILGRCFEAMPDDREIGELLCEALVMAGRRAEAERVRRRVAAEMASME